MPGARVEPVRAARRALVLACAVTALTLVSAPAALAACDPTIRSVGLRQAGGETCVTAQLTAGPQTQFPPPGTVDFDASTTSTTDTGGIVTWEWDWEGDGTWDTAPNSPVVSHEYTTRGQYVATVRATDSVGSSDMATVTITVGGPPTASFTVAPNPALVGQTVNFDGSASVPDAGGTIVRFDWDLDGNGSFETPSVPLTSPTISPAYANPGVFDVAVRVTNDAGITDTDTHTLTINAPPGSGGGGGEPGGGGPGGGGGEGGGSTGAGTGGGATGGGGSGPGSPAGNRFAAFLAGSPIQRLRTILRRGVTVTCGATRAATCSLRVELDVRSARRLGLARRRARRPVALALGTVRIAASRARTVKLRLTRRGRRALRRVRSLRLTVRGVAKTAAGDRVSLARVVVVRR